MKYFSEVINKFFDTEAECRKEEAKYLSQTQEKEKAKKVLDQKWDAACTAFEDYIAEYDKYIAKYNGTDADKCLCGAFKRLLDEFSSDPF